MRRRRKECRGGPSSSAAPRAAGSEPRERRGADRRGSARQSSKARRRPARQRVPGDRSSRDRPIDDRNPAPGMHSVNRPLHRPASRPRGTEVVNLSDAGSGAPAADDRLQALWCLGRQLHLDRDRSLISENSEVWAVDAQSAVGVLSQGGAGDRTPLGSLRQLQLALGGNEVVAEVLADQPGGRGAAQPVIDPAGTAATFSPRSA